MGLNCMETLREYARKVEIGVEVNPSADVNNIMINSLICIYLYLILAIVCPILQVPNGLVYFSNRVLRPGTIATYRCYRGFKLVGNFKRRCLNNREWVGSDPVCKRKKLTHKHSGLCTIFLYHKMPENGKWTMDSPTS